MGWIEGRRGWLGNISSSKFSNRRWLQSYIRWLEEQDKVNYAVSEREDRVKDFDKVDKDVRLYWDVLGCNWAEKGCNRLYWAVLSCTELYWVVVGCTWLY